jgi:hypothetical protein
MTLSAARIACRDLIAYVWDPYSSSPSAVKGRRENPILGASSPKFDDNTAGYPLGCLVGDSPPHPVRDVA